MFFMLTICFCLSKYGSDNTFHKFPNCLTSQVQFSVLTFTHQLQLAFIPAKTSISRGSGTLHCCLWRWVYSFTHLLRGRKELRSAAGGPGFKPQTEIAGFLTRKARMRATWQSDCTHTHGLHFQVHQPQAQGGYKWSVHFSLKIKSCPLT